MRTICLVSCVSKKQAAPVEAKDLYISNWFCKARKYVEQTGCDWFILSAEHELLDPDLVIAPYEKTLNTMRKAKRQEWADNVCKKLLPKLVGYDRVIFLAGVKYREFLIAEIQEKGLTVEIPLEKMRIGEQLAWLKKAIEK